MSELDTAFLQPDEEEDTNQERVNQEDQEDLQGRQEVPIIRNTMAEAQAYRDTMNTMKYLPNIQSEKFKGTSDKYEVSQ